MRSGSSLGPGPHGMPKHSLRATGRLAVAAICLVVALVAASRHWGWNAASPLWRFVTAHQHDNPSETGHNHRDTPHHDHPEHGHSEHGHPEQGHDEHEHPGTASAGQDELTLSYQAQCNIGLTGEYLKPVVLSNFRRSITVPAVVSERLGRTRLEVSTPMAGMITHVHATQGEAVSAGTLLFQLRITAEELVSTQTEFLRTVGEIDVEQRELDRLTRASETGAIPQKTILERQYAKEKLAAQLLAQREALRLHGLSDRQVVEIEQHRRLLRELQIMAPGHDTHTDGELKLLQRAPSRHRPVAFHRARDTNEESMTTQEVAGQELNARAINNRAINDQAPNTEPDPSSTHVPPWLVLQEVRVHKGQTVDAGDTLAVLADYSELFIQGHAFDQDIEMIAQSAQRGWHATALLDCGRGIVQVIENLEFVYAANEIDSESRSLPFYVRLPNEIVRESTSPDGQHFVEWKYRPGRRLQLQVPVEQWENQLVVPVDALARDGAESFVFRYDGQHFQRVPVHLTYRDQLHAVIAAGENLQPGDTIALRSAHQLQMAFKNRNSAGIDPHAGHTH